MLELLQNIISVFINDATLTASVPVANIFTGPVDIVTEAQANLSFPQIQLSIVSETTRSVPTNTRDTLIQISIFSRNSMMEVLWIYERIINLLEYHTATIPTDGGQATIWWEKISGAVDQYESDRRLWHRAVTITAWSQK